LRKTVPKVLSMASGSEGSVFPSLFSLWYCFKSNFVRKFQFKSACVCVYLTFWAQQVVLFADFVGLMLHATLCMLFAQKCPVFGKN